MDSVPTPRPIDGHPPGGRAAMQTAAMFERDDLFTAERRRDLRAAADQVRTVSTDEPGLIGRARQWLGAGLIAIGTAIAGARRAAATLDVPCDDCGVGAAA